MVGTCGNDVLRLAPVTAKARTRPAWMSGSVGGTVPPAPPPPCVAGLTV